MGDGASCSPDFVRFVAETYRDDPYGYRLDILGRAPCPDPADPSHDWQRDVCESVTVNKRTAVAAGHGPGKTALAADLIHWFIATRPRPAIVATANTEDQLQKKLWRELNKVNGQAKNREWFDWRASTFTMFGEVTQQAVALAWSENNPDAFAGTHEDHVLGVFDEGSAIARCIWNTFGGAMTTPGARWLALGNSTIAEGYFYDITHGKLVARKPGDLQRGMWKSFIVPSTMSPFVDPAWIEEMRMTLSEDDYRMRVLGLPPRYHAEQFFSRDIVTAAMERVVDTFPRWPLIIGADVGRGDRSVLVPRRGRKVLPKVEILRGERTTDFSRRIADEIRFWREDEGLDANVVIEELGMGVGVVETLQDMGYADRVFGVNTGVPASDPDLYLNLRCEMYALTKEWLEDLVELPNVPQLMDDLLSVKRKPSGTGKLRLETKEEMRRRGLPSPDVGDALALTFAVPFDLLPERRKDAWADAFAAQSTGRGSWMAN